MNHDIDEINRLWETVSPRLNVEIPHPITQNSNPEAVTPGLLLKYERILFGMYSDLSGNAPRQYTRAFRELAAIQRERLTALMSAVFLIKGILPDTDNSTEPTELPGALYRCYELERRLHELYKNDPEGYNEYGAGFTEAKLENLRRLRDITAQWFSAGY